MTVFLIIIYLIYIFKKIPAEPGKFLEIGSSLSNLHFRNLEIRIILTNFNTIYKNAILNFKFVAYI